MSKHRIISSIARKQHQALLTEAIKKGVSVSAMVSIILTERYPNDIEPQYSTAGSSNAQ